MVDNFSTSKPINSKLKKRINFFKVDLTKKKEVNNFFKKKNFDIIVHLAAYSGVQEFNNNILKCFKK